jgi:GNAT superfamily N-acetyltransferase
VLDTLKIKTVTPDDSDAVLKVYRQCEDFLALGPQPKASLEMVLQDIEEAKKKGGVFRGIYYDEKMIGVVSYVRGGFEGKAEVAFISLLMIAAPYRQKGIGQEVVKRIEKEILKNSQIKLILSAVQVNNPDARRFWEKNGYRVISGEPEIQADKTTVFRLRKDINK